MKAIPFIYGLLGLLLFVGGLQQLFFNPSDVKEVKHFAMEFGASLNAIGLFLLVGAFKPSKLKPFDFVFIIFFAFFSFIHWYEFYMGNRTIQSPLINSIPLIVYLIVILLRIRSNKQ